MTKEQIIEKIKENKITEKDLFEYYEVKNLEGFEMALEEKIKETKINIEYINGAFKFIFEAREQEEYNPLQEKYYFFSAIFPAMYGISAEEINIIVRAFGLYKAVMVLDEVLKEKPEIIYFKQLYKMYEERRTNMSLMLEKSLAGIIKLLDERTKDMDMEKLKKLGETVLEEMNKFSKT
jgi:hypothetical protein